MSKQEIVKSLRQEIRKINYVIDQKIIQGESYYRESRRHRFLISQMNRLSPPKENWFTRSMSMVSLFML